MRGNNIFHIVLTHNIEQLEWIFLVTKTCLSPADLKTFFLSKTKNGSNVIQIAAASKNFDHIQKLFVIFENDLKFSVEEMKELLENENDEGKSAVKISIEKETEEVVEFLVLKLSEFN